VPRGTLKPNGLIVRNCTLQPSDKVPWRMAMTRFHHAGGAISTMTAVILSGSRTRSRRVLSVGLQLTTPVGEDHCCEARHFTSDQAELDRPAEELVLCGAKTVATRNARPFSRLYHCPRFARR
jgi:hypothetical protein